MEDIELGVETVAAAAATYACMTGLGALSGSVQKIATQAKEAQARADEIVENTITDFKTRLGEKLPKLDQQIKNVETGADGVKRTAAQKKYALENLRNQKDIYRTEMEITHQKVVDQIENEQLAQKAKLFTVANGINIFKNVIGLLPGCGSAVAMDIDVVEKFAALAEGKDKYVVPVTCKNDTVACTWDHDLGGAGYTCCQKGTTCDPDQKGDTGCPRHVPCSLCEFGYGKPTVGPQTYCCNEQDKAKCQIDKSAPFDPNAKLRVGTHCWAGGT